MDPSTESPAEGRLSERSSRREVLRKLGPTGLLGLAWTAMPAIMGVTLLYNMDALSEFLRRDPVLGFAGYIAVFIVSAGLGLLPTYSQSILGGWVFGLAWGLPGALLGFVGGSLVGYFTAKTVSQDRVEEVINSKPKWRAVRDALVGGGFWKTLGLVTLVRLPPNSPFALTNLLLSTTGVPLAPYAIGTAIGMLPRTAIAVGLAAAASHAAGDQGIGAFIRESRKNTYILIGGVLVMFVVLGVIGHIANKALARATRAREGYCPSCGYDTRSLNGLVCPECGGALVEGTRGAAAAD